MSVSEVLKTRTGIKSLLLPNGYKDGTIFAFEYTDKKIEVHSLHQECAPLCLEENTRVSPLNLEQSGALLLAVTPIVKQSKCSVLFRLWDSSNVLGFTSKEIQIAAGERQIIQDGKFRCLLHYNESKSDMPVINVDSFGSFVVLRLDSEALVWKAAKKEPNIIILQVYSNVKLKNFHPGIDVALLEENGKYALIAGEIGSLSVWSLEKSDVLDSKSYPLPQRSTGNLPIPQRFFRVSKSKLLFNDDGGKVWVFSVKTNIVVNIKLPGLHAGCNIFSIMNRNQQKSTILAVCNEAHAINIYDLGDLTCDDSQEVISCQRPLKILFSIAPVNALGFIKNEFIALASSSNRTLTLWRILASN